MAQSRQRNNVPLPIRRRPEEGDNGGSGRVREITESEFERSLETRPAEPPFARSAENSNYQEEAIRAEIEMETRRGDSLIEAMKARNRRDKEG